MRPLRVALLQMTGVARDLDANLATGEAFCRQAGELGADIALFPEMWSIAYALPSPDDTEAWEHAATAPRDPFVRHFGRLAAHLDLALALTFLEAWPGAPRNSVSLINRRGETVFTYAKVHTCDFDKEARLTPGQAFVTRDLDTAVGPVRVGAMICHDREYPESARVLMLQGAEIVLTPNACPLDESRLGQFRARAFENMLGVAMANYAAPRENGHSVAYSPIVFDEGGGCVDPRLVEAGSEEGVFVAEFDLEAIRAYRAREVWGNSYRKPYAYELLTAPTVQPPFARPDARRERPAAGP